MYASTEDESSMRLMLHEYRSISAANTSRFRDIMALRSGSRMSKAYEMFDSFMGDTRALVSPLLPSSPFVSSDPRFGLAIAATTEGDVMLRCPDSPWTGTVILASTSKLLYTIVFGALSIS
jgi:hypothetical protein